MVASSINNNSSSHRDHRKGLAGAARCSELMQREPRSATSLRRVQRVLALTLALRGGSTSAKCAADHTGTPTARRQQAEVARFDYLRGPQSPLEKEVRHRMCATKVKRRRHRGA